MKVTLTFQRQGIAWAFFHRVVCGVNWGNHLFAALKLKDDIKIVIILLGDGPEKAHEAKTLMINK